MPNQQTKAVYTNVNGMEKLDQSYLHLLIKHPKTDMSRAKINMSQPGIKPRPPSSKASTLPKS